MKQTPIFSLIALVFLMASCVSTKKLEISEARYSRLDSSHRQLQKQYAALQDSVKKYQASEALVRGQFDLHKKATDQLLDELKGLDIIKGTQEEIIKRSFDNLMGKYAYIREFQNALARKDSINTRLLADLKQTLGNVGKEGVDVKTEKGAVVIDIADRLLFKTGAYQVSDSAKVLLGKVAEVLTRQPELEIMVKGHTDTVRFSQGALVDNWDLSVKRATSVIRVLQDSYRIAPERMTAAGNGHFDPLASNATGAGRAVNRRTQIMILPDMEQIFKILEKPMQVNDPSSGKKY